MRIRAIRAIPVRIPRDLNEAAGTAGTPTPLPGGSRLQWAATYKTIYSTCIESLLVRVETEDGIVGWGEAQAPVAPEVAKAVIDGILAPVLIGEDALAPEAAWDRMYSTMRVRGQTGGFMHDAIAGVDCALWDICGQNFKQPIARLLGGPVRNAIPIYISGLSGNSLAERLQFAGTMYDQGARAFKLFLNTDEGECLELISGLRHQFESRIQIYVDALWRLDLKQALIFARELAGYKVGFLEAPFAPEDVRGHAKLADASPVPIAIGESYRTRYELLPFLEAGACHILQPDLGRCGITEGRKLAHLAETFHVRVIPHVSIGLGPQIAAAIHYSCALPGVKQLECNPLIYKQANQFLKMQMPFDAEKASLPAGDGLGVQLQESALQKFIA